MNVPRLRRPSTLRLASLLPLLLLQGAAGPEGAVESQQVRRDLAFARGVAARFQYVDVAERALGRVDERGLSDALREEYDLVRCDVYAAGARGEPSLEKRLALYDKAVDAYVDFMAKHPYSDFAAEAESAYISLVDDYAYSATIALEDLVGEPAEALRTRMSDVIQDAVKRVDKVLDGLESGNDRWKAMLYKGRLLLSLAKISEEGIFFFSRCEETLEALALDAGDLTFWGMNAYLLIADAKLAQNRYRDAVDFAGFVVTTAIPFTKEQRDAVDWDDLPQEMKQRRFELVERGTPFVIDALLSQGKSTEATHWSLHFQNSWKRDGVALSPQGYVALLSCARALLEAGGWVGGTVADADLVWFETEDEMRAAGFRSRRDTRRAIDQALSLAQTVNEENRGNTLQIRAQRLIAEVIERPGIVPDPEVLFEAAQGDYNAKNYVEALDAFKRILTVLDTRDEATKKQFGASVMYHIGASLARLDRYLEAAMAFREGATTWRGDPEYDPKNARGYYDAISVVRRDAGGDPAIEALWREAEQARLDLEGGSQGDIVFRQAMRLYQQQDYAGARSKFQSIEAGEDVYEEAVARAALCLYKQDELDAAKREFKRYLESYVTDAKNKLTTRSKQGARQKAMAQATFYLGRIDFQKGDWAGVVNWLGDFNEKFEEQTDYAPVAMYMVIESELNQKKFADAKRTFTEMRKAYPTHERTGVAAVRIFQVLEQEQKAAAEAGEKDAARDLLEQMAEYMRISNDLDSSPSFANLRKETKLWIDLGRWPEAEAVLRRTIQAFQGDKSVAGDMDKYVRPDLGLVLLAQKKVPEAFEVLDPLVPDPNDDSDTRRPAAEVVRNWARSVSGWVEGDARNVVEVPGVGGAEKLEAATDYLWKLGDREEKWTCPWYTLRFEYAYAMYQLALLDSSNMKFVVDRIGELQSFLLDDQLAGIAKACGDEILQRRFLWLLGKAK